MQVNQERMLYTDSNDSVLRPIRNFGFLCDAQYASNHTCATGLSIATDTDFNDLCAQGKCTL